MKSIQLQACAKVNLYLEILGVRPDNFHELVMVLQSVSLADTLVLTGARSTSLICSHPEVPLDASNLVLKAVELVRQSTGVDRHVEIKLEKRIPVAAGLAGGSTNAAAVLVGLNVLWDLGLTQKELQKLGAQLGSDIPFCVVGGTALAMGRGEVLSALPALQQVHLVLAKHKTLQVSTAWAYKTYRQEFLSHAEPPAPRARTSALLSAVASQSVERIAALLHNDLERAVLPAHPAIAALRERFIEAGALGAMMSGSGPTVFALARDRAHAEAIQAVIAADPELDCFVAATQPAGILLDET